MCLGRNRKPYHHRLWLKTELVSHDTSYLIENRTSSNLQHVASKCSNVKNTPTMNVINAVNVLFFIAAVCSNVSRGHGCECELAEYTNCSRTIDIAVLMQNSTARQALPIIYLAKKDLEEQGLRGPLQNWSISITYRDTKGSNVDAVLEAFRLHDAATKRCQVVTPQTLHNRQAAKPNKSATEWRWSEEDCEQEERSQLDLFLGPVEPFSTVVVTRQASGWKIPVLSPNQYTEKPSEEFKYLYNINGDYAQLAVNTRKLLNEWGWKNIHIIFESHEKNSVKGKTTCFFAMDSINKELRKNNFKVDYTPSYNDATHSITQDFNNVTEEARVILMCLEDRARLVEMMDAAKSPPCSEKEEYVFLFIDITADAAENPYSLSDSQIRWLELNTTEAESFEPMFVITARTPATEHQQLTKRVRDLLKDNSQAELQEHLKTMDASLTSLSEAPLFPVSASFYNGVWLFFNAFNKTLEKKLASWNAFDITAELFNEMSNGIFYGRLRDENYTVQDRTIPVQYSLLNWRRVNNEASFKEVAFIDGASSSSKQWTSTNETIYWYGENYSWVKWSSSRPNDIPEGGFKDECKNDGLKSRIATGLLAASAGILSALIAVFVWKYYKEKQLERRIWTIEFKDIMIIDIVQQKEKRIGNHLPSLMDLRGSYNSLLELPINGPTKYGRHKGEIVIVKLLPESRVNIDKDLLVELTEMKLLADRNLANFIGAGFEAPNNFLVTEFCPKRSLFDILEDKSQRLEDLMKYSLLHDLIQGLSKLHSSKIKYHGNLKSSNCVINSQFVLKVTDFGLLSLRNLEPSEFNQGKLWSPPEKLREPSTFWTTNQVKQGDIYSLGIIMNEILTRKGIFPLSLQNPKKDEATYKAIVEKITNEKKSPPKPVISQDVEEDLRDLIESCWEEPEKRPELSTVKKTIQEFYEKLESGNIMDNILRRMEEHSNDLERTVEKKTKAYLKEKQNCENLLYQLLPPSVTNALILEKPVEAESFDSVTIYFSDIVGFTALSAESSPRQVVDMLNELYFTFDKRLKEFDVYKVETIGDAYMVVSGLPERNDTEHAGEIAKMALALRDEVTQFKIPHMPERQLKIRVGVHSGPCVAGVVGLKMPRYCLFGATVNIASRMESSGEPMKIHLSSATYDLLQGYPEFQVERRQPSIIKDKNLGNTYWLNGDTESTCTPACAQPENNVTPPTYQEASLPSQDSQAPNKCQITIREFPGRDLDIEAGLRTGGHVNDTRDAQNERIEMRNFV